MQTELVQEKFGNRIRNRACAIVIRKDSILLIEHLGLTATPLLSPPGGEPHFGESLQKAVLRELYEETRLTATDPKFLFSCEFIRGSLHAIEHYFLVEANDNDVFKGIDPELSTENQIIKSAKFWKYQEFKNNSAVTLHDILKATTSVSGLLSFTGYYINGKKPQTKV